MPISVHDAWEIAVDPVERARLRETFRGAASEGKKLKAAIEDAESAVQRAVQRVEGMVVSGESPVRLSSVFKTLVANAQDELSGAIKHCEQMAR